MITQCFNYIAWDKELNAAHEFISKALKKLTLGLCHLLPLKFISWFPGIVFQTN